MGRRAHSVPEREGIYQREIGNLTIGDDWGLRYCGQGRHIILFPGELKAFCGGGVWCGGVKTSLIRWPSLEEERNDPHTSLFSTGAQSHAAHLLTWDLIVVS